MENKKLVVNLLEHAKHWSDYVGFKKSYQYGCLLEFVLKENGVDLKDHKNKNILQLIDDYCSGGTILSSEDVVNEIEKMSKKS